MRYIFFKFFIMVYYLYTLRVKLDKVENVHDKYVGVLAKLEIFHRPFLVRENLEQNSSSEAQCNCMRSRRHPFLTF